MWKEIRTRKDYFLLFDEEQYEIFLTDFISIWHECFSKSSFIDRLKESNSKLNMVKNSLLGYGILLVKYPEFVNKVEIKPVEEDVSVTFVGSQKLNKSIPFKIHLKFKKGTRKLFFQKVTGQLFKTIESLKSSQKELFRLLKKKDVEIEDYKFEGAKVTIKANETEKFDEEEHTLKYCTEVVPNSVVDRILYMVEENKTIKHGSNDCDIKAEPCASASVTSIKIEPSTPIEIRNEFTYPMTNDVKMQSNEQRATENNSLQQKRVRQQRYREQNREKLKQRERERRQRQKYSEIISEDEMSTNYLSVAGLEGTQNLLVEINEGKQESNECNIKAELCASTSVTSIKIEPSTPIEIRNEFTYPMTNDVKMESNEQRATENNSLQQKRVRQQRYREQNREKLKQRERERRQRQKYSEIISEDEMSTNYLSVAGLEETQNLLVEINEGNQDEAIKQPLKRELPLPDANEVNNALKREVDNEINAMPTRNQEIKKEVLTTGHRKKPRKFCF